MEPKFQSSFIPKGPVSSASMATQNYAVRKPKSILGFLAMLIFVFSLLGAAAVLGYKFYLSYSIKTLAAEVEAGKAAIEEETVQEIMRLNNRMLSAETLIDKHLIITPFLDFLEKSTLRTVRFREFSYIAENSALRLNMKGEARSYSSLAQQAELFKKSKDIKNPTFSDISLDDKGNVTFTVSLELDRNFLSYGREVERTAAPVAPAQTSLTPPPSAATSTATSTPRQATTTPRN